MKFSRKVYVFGGGDDKMPFFIENHFENQYVMTTYNNKNSLIELVTTFFTLNIHVNLRTRRVRKMMTS